MAKYYIDYKDKSGDLCHVWTRAHDEVEARQNVEQEYWDIDTIYSIRRAND